jgi:hypothetical protein
MKKTVTEEQSYALPKRSLKGLKMLRATRLRHPSVRESDDGELSYYINFIVVKSGNSSASITARCTKEVFQKVYGKQKEEDSVPVGGYATSTGMSFLLFQDADTKVIEAIVAYPNITASSRSGRAPEDLAKIENIEWIISPNGSMEINSTHYPDRGITVFHVPYKINKNDLDKIIFEMLGLEGFNIGDTIAKTTVVNIIGNRLNLEP